MRGMAGGGKGMTARVARVSGDVARALLLEMGFTRRREEREGGLGLG